MLVLWLVLAGLALFARGFFPANPGSPGYSTELPPVQPMFDRLVFVVIDALRSDLLLGESSQFHNVHALIRSGQALPFTGFASPPTVTLPRLKGLTTGAAPSFLDAVLNIAESDSAALHHDSWVAQMNLQNRTLHMFGDDTWLKLFPGVFADTDGTSSFYVTDYTEVDNNVTRHLDTQLASKEWDTLILHYLGLDHIGHKGGPNSPLMGPKQREMDAIVSKVFESCDERTLILVTGDHGMNDVGNHGGSTAGETSAGLILASPRFSKPQNAPLPENDDYRFYNKIHQSDIVPTLSLLYGLPIPKNSLGIPIPEILSMWSEEEQESILTHICQHFSTFGFNEECTLENLVDAQESFTRASNAYNITYMLQGIAVLVLALGIAAYRVLFKVNVSSKAKFVWFLTTGLYALAMFGSSTIEEEHQFWFWGFGGVIAILATTRKSSQVVWWVAALAAFRAMRAYHHPGQKWTIGYDISVLLKENVVILWTSVFLTYSNVMYHAQTGFLGFAALVISFVFKVTYAHYSGEPVPQLLSVLVMQEDRLNLMARLVFGFSAVAAGFHLYRKQFSISLLEAILLTQTRLENIPMFLLYSGIRYVLSKELVPPSQENDAWWSVVILFLQYSSFFASGGSNSLATVDLAMAYNGVSSYNIPLVTVLTFVSNWVGPIYWSGVAAEFLKTITIRDAFLELFYTASIGSVTLACLILRDHLFIWTVFSPKLLYAAVWLVFQTMLVDSTLVMIIKDRLNRK